MPVKNRRYIIPALLVLILFIPACAAVPVERQSQTGVFFMSGVSGKDLGAVNLLIMSEAELNEEKTAIIIAIGGNISVSAYIDGVILTLFTKTVSTANVKYGIISMKYIAFPFNLVAGLALLAVFRDMMEQSAAYFDKNKKSVVKFGLYGYIMAALLTGIFFISAAGAPIAILGILAMIMITLAGHIPASIILGFSMQKMFRRCNIYGLFALGSVIIGSIKMLPVLGDIFTFFVMPALSLGIFSVYIIHKHFYKAYVWRNFESRDVFNRKKINSIILKHTDMDRGEYDEEKKSKR